MKNLISLTTFFVCLTTGQIFCPHSVQATAKFDTKNSVQANVTTLSFSDLIAQNGDQNGDKYSSSRDKQVFPRCRKNCDNSGGEGGGGG